jgi:hypothetical protein
MLHRSAHRRPAPGESGAGTTMAQSVGGMGAKRSRPRRMRGRAAASWQQEYGAGEGQEVENLPNKGARSRKQLDSAIQTFTKPVSRLARPTAPLFLARVPAPGWPRATRIPRSLANGANRRYARSRPSDPGRGACPQTARAFAVSKLCRCIDGLGGVERTAPKHVAGLRLVEAHRQLLTSAELPASSSGRIGQSKRKAPSLLTHHRDSTARCHDAKCPDGRRSRECLARVVLPADKHVCATNY